jgi:cytoplasmic iron level regulating protein YaaA (DUF328/UPF0246 family)
MLIIISPAKTIDETPIQVNVAKSHPEFLKEAETIVQVLKKYSPARIAKLMRINPKLAQLNFERYQEWSLPFTNDNSKPALFAFNGDVYNGLKANEYSHEDLQYAQQNLRILSGLYGLMKPMDLMQPYRLEMGTNLKLKRKGNLYEFWGKKLTISMNAALENAQTDVLINLASNEYYKVLQPNALNCKIITPVFKEFSNGTYKFMSVFGKRARGLMASYIIRNRLEHPDELKLFGEEGYFYNDNLTEGNQWVFTRG